MTATYATARQEAVNWAVRSQDALFDDWEALEQWLMADPLHADLYDSVTIAADDGARSISIVASDPARIVTLANRWRTWVPFALAASLVAAVGGGSLFLPEKPSSARYAATGPAERRTFKLDGSTMTLDGDTQVSLDGADTRTARINRGQVLFAVTHDSNHPFKVEVGDVVVTDVGTVFDIERSHDAIIIGVAEGEVHVATPAGGMNLSSGQIVSITDNDAQAVVRTEAPALIGIWRSGRIDFADTTMEVLAERLHRATGARIEVSPAIAKRRATGSILAKGDATATFRTLSALIGISITRHGDGWVWSSHSLDSPT